MSPKSSPNIAFAKKMDCSFSTYLNPGSGIPHAYIPASNRTLPVASSNNASCFSSAPVPNHDVTYQCAHTIVSVHDTSPRPTDIYHHIKCYQRCQKISMLNIRRNLAIRSYTLGDQIKHFNAGSKRTLEVGIAVHLPSDGSTTRKSPHPCIILTRTLRHLATAWQASLSLVIGNRATSVPI